METNMIQTNQINLIENPVVLQNLRIMRDKNTTSQEVRIAARKITQILLYEASKSLPTVKTIIETPLQVFESKDIDPELHIIISPILRAGLIFTDEAVDILPQACIRHIGMYRDEETLTPVWYYNKVSLEDKSPQKTYVLITDPMLATGNSLIEAVKIYTAKGIPTRNIKILSIISAPEGIANIHNQFPEIEITTTAIDSHLNARGYIVPGMGDAGDRIFNT